MPDIPSIGEVLYEEFMQPLGLSQNALAKSLGVPQNRISDIISGKRGISADTDLRLCRFFGLTDGYFAGMQLDFERIATKRAIVKLAMLNRSASLHDLTVPPSNRLEKLSLNREGQYSIRINDQFRVCFRWTGNDAEDVEIVDYH